MVRTYLMAGAMALGLMAQPAGAQISDDVVKIYKSLFEMGDPYKFIDLPISNYASSSYDKLVAKGGKTVGLSMFAGYSYNERSVLSLGVVDHDVEVGTE